ncbi:hypothetical protein HRG_008139 [Hirsutella rhossiliensis]|uniref:Uncharacterized protein n=1 Tax=Hirsutella rhossiliensis TaxID=111463 RepID=A0A9P8MVG9_9HYPO|nr:uncharacterized protein HRG_08139 [Hirsutella rhossiliensis]KAH0960986.1 hypothetical protein HRG_08139 [Hirsutella rhossiliensis]
MASITSRRGQAKPQLMSSSTPVTTTSTPHPSSHEAPHSAAPSHNGPHQQRTQFGTRSGQSEEAEGDEVDEDQEEGDELTDDIEEPSTPPSITLFPPEPSSSTTSVNTYNSLLSEDDEDDVHDDAANGTGSIYCADDAATPVVLPPRYRPAGLVIPADPALRPSDPYTFGRLFPSLDRLAIRHDDASADGNMNLRVETVVAPGMRSGSLAGPGPVLGRSRRAATVQLFHLRMHNLARREFSLRRYCRDSGREVCGCKRAYATQPSPSPADSSAGFPRSVSAALRSVKTPFRRPSSSSSSSSGSAAGSTRSSSSLFSRRPSTRGSLATTTAQSVSPGSRRGSTDSAASSLSVATSQSPPQPASLLVPTDTIKLEFSNYARVDVRRHGARRYEFEWWGHEYAWKRSVDKTLNTVSFHLVRDGHGDPVAHIVPEVRSPNQVSAEDRAGGWIPPCYMWISDPAVVEAMTDVADIIVATGLMALVDDCIRDRWQVKKPAPLVPARPHVADAGRSRSAVRDFFSRRLSTQHSHSPLRVARTLTVH